MQQQVAHKIDEKPVPDSAVIEDVEGEDRGEESEAKADSSDVFYSLNEGYEGNEAGVGQSPA